MATYLNQFSITKENLAGSVICFDGYIKTLSIDDAEKVYKQITGSAIKEVENIPLANSIVEQMNLAHSNVVSVYECCISSQSDKHNYIVFSFDIKRCLTKMEILLKFIDEFQSLPFYEELLEVRSAENWNNTYRNCSPMEWINSFAWSRTKRGEDYWIERDKEWQCRCSYVLEAVCQWQTYYKLANKKIK